MRSAKSGLPALLLWEIAFTFSEEVPPVPTLWLQQGTGKRGGVSQLCAATTPTSCRKLV